MGSKGSNAAVSAWFEGERGENWGLSKGGNVANLAPDVKKAPCRALNSEYIVPAMSFHYNHQKAHYKMYPCTSLLDHRVANWRRASSLTREVL